MGLGLRGLLRVRLSVFSWLKVVARVGLFSCSYMRTYKVQSVGFRVY